MSRLIQAPPQSTCGAIARNLGHVLNTRRGCGSVIAEFGLGSYESAPTTHEAVLLLREEIEQLTMRYEPRLASPQVTLLGGHGAREVRFELRGRVSDGDLVLWLDIDTTTREVVVTVGAES